MLSGFLRYKVDFYKQYGEDNNIDYSLYKTVKAQILYKNGASVIESYQLLNTETISIKIRSRKDLDSTMRVKINNKFYNIIHLQPVGHFNQEVIIDLALIM